MKTPWAPPEVRIREVLLGYGAVLHTSAHREDGTAQKGPYRRFQNISGNPFQCLRQFPVHPEPLPHKYTTTPEDNQNSRAPPQTKQGRPAETAPLLTQPVPGTARTHEKTEKKKNSSSHERSVVNILSRRGCGFHEFGNGRSPLLRESFAEPQSGPAVVVAANGHARSTVYSASHSHQ